MERSYCLSPESENRIYGKELEMWENGYVKAYTNHTYNDFTIYAGEYFKAVYDNGNNEIYLEKEDGTAG